ncbi:hypothetical protein MR813_05585 [bacterium]|nr:hypothetical protein [bacterium]
MQYILLILTSLFLFGSCRNFQSNSQNNVPASEYREYDLSKSEVAPGADYEPAGYEPAGYGYGEYEYARSVVTPPAANAYKSGENIVYAISTANNLFKIDLNKCTARFIKKLPAICTDRDARPVVVSKIFIDYKENDVIVFDADYCQISISPELHRGALFITDNVSSGYGDIKEMSVAAGQNMDYGDYNISIESGIIHIGYCGEDYEIPLVKPSLLSSAIRWNFPFGALFLLISLICVLYVIVSLFRSSQHRDGAKAERKTIYTIKRISPMEIGNILQFAEHLERMHQTTPQQQGAEGRAVSPQEQNSEGAAVMLPQQGAEGAATGQKLESAEKTAAAVQQTESSEKTAATVQQTESAEGLLRVGSESLRESLPDYLPSSIAGMVVEQAKGIDSDATLAAAVAEIAQGKAIWEALSRIGKITEELSKIDDINIYRLTEGYEPSAIAKSVRERCAELSERFKEESRLLYLNLSNADIASLESIGLGARSSFYRDFLLLLVFIDYKSKIGIRKIALLTDSTLATVHARKAELLKNKLGSNIERLAESFNPISLIIKRAYNNLNNI